jgi:hypothetical protein
VSIIVIHFTYLDVVADVLSQECRGLNWTLVAKHLDHQALVIRSEQDYQLLSRFFVRVAGCAIPAAGLLSQNWNNRAAQFAVLTLAANSPRNIVDFSALIAPDQIIQGEGISTPPNYSWLCLMLYPRFFFLAACGMGNEVVDVLTKVLYAVMLLCCYAVMLYIPYMLYGIRTVVLPLLTLLLFSPSPLPLTPKKGGRQLPRVLPSLPITSAGHHLLRSALRPAAQASASLHGPAGLPPHLSVRDAQVTQRES